MPGIEVSQPSLHAEDHPDFRAWRAYHLYYHGDQNLMLRRSIQPLMKELLDRGLIDRFYFVRYSLGGPHIRLRWRLTNQDAQCLAEAALAEGISQFFTLCPSTKSMPREEIQKLNESVLLDSDPSGPQEEDGIFGDNSWRLSSPLFEVARYGGWERLGASLDLFCLSSANVLCLLVERESWSGGWERTIFMRLALHLAWGLVEKEDEFLAVAAYCVRKTEGPYQRIIADADTVFEKQSAQITALIHEELAKGDPELMGYLDQGSFLLANQLRSLEWRKCHHLAASHLHMTANRLGLNNAEEIYVLRILSRACTSLRLQQPHDWAEFLSRRAERASSARHGNSFEKIIALALRELCRPAQPAA
jgi:hypothetical protein